MGNDLIKFTTIQNRLDIAYSNAMNKAKKLGIKFIRKNNAFYVTEEEMGRFLQHFRDKFSMKRSKDKIVNDIYNYRKLEGEVSKIFNSSKFLFKVTDTGETLDCSILEGRLTNKEFEALNWVAGGEIDERSTEEGFVLFRFFVDNHNLK